MRESVVAYIGVGANLGDAARVVVEAIHAVGRLPSTVLIATSSLYRTAPIDSSGDDYINAVVKTSTILPVYSLLRLLQRIELEAGRERPYRNAPRTLDLDLLLYGDAQISSEELTVPHTRIHDRAFVLAPLREIAPQLVSMTQMALVADQRIDVITD